MHPWIGLIGMGLILEKQLEWIELGAMPCEFCAMQLQNQEEQCTSTSLPVDIVRTSNAISPLKYWREQSNDYPILSAVARRQCGRHFCNLSTV